ncbi:MAG: D-3-phosphoglycerate dehydrogenase [Lentisphaeria bacterium]|jgi:D-3-phosphoglycerate dehydrogenase
MNLIKTSLEKNKIKIVLLEGIHQSAVDSLLHSGYRNVDYVDTALTGEALKERLKDAHFVGLRSRTQLTREVIESAPKLMAVGCFCIGTNQVDLKAAREHGVAVFNAPFSNTRSVAELVIAQAILLLRDIPAKNAGCHRGEWNKSASSSYEMRGKTLGLIGYGSIGSQISVLAEAMGMSVIFYDIVTKLTLGNAIQCKSLNELLAKSDVVSLHVPETPDTKNMLGEREFAIMKAGSIVINASRGTVIDIDALANALELGHLVGAAIDVFPSEPKSNSEEFISPLRKFDNVILTPHIGGSTVEAQENIGYEVAEKLVKYSDNGTTLSSVNFPEVALPTHRDVHRLLHVHKNVPGVLMAVNKVFSENNINIVGQYLQTNESVGYVVIDVNAECSEVALEHIKQVPGTIRCRVLF